MYRYFLFYSPWYYPSGGMHDCELKTNNFDEIVPFINKHHRDDHMSVIHYYDYVEDKIRYAVMEDYEDEDCWTRQKFLCWSDKRI